MDRGRAHSERRRKKLMLLALLVVQCVCRLPARAMAAETIFLQDGRTIQADKVEIVGDTVRIERPSETIEVPRSEVLSIHPSAAPRTSPDPADVYRDMTRQMNDKIRREIENRPGAR